MRPAPPPSQPSSLPVHRSCERRSPYRLLSIATRCSIPSALRTCAGRSSAGSTARACSVRRLSRRSPSVFSIKRTTQTYTRQGGTPSILHRQRRPADDQVPWAGRARSSMHTITSDGSRSRPAGCRVQIENIGCARRWKAAASATLTMHRPAQAVSAGTSLVVLIPICNPLSCVYAACVCVLSP